MKEVNLWDIKYGSDCKYTSSIDDVIKAINNGDIFDIVDTFDSEMDNDDNYLKTSLKDKNISCVFCDEEHPVFISLNKIFVNSSMSHKFYNKYKEQIVKACQNYAFSHADYTITINNSFFDDNFFKRIVEVMRGKSIYFNNVSLTDEQISKLKENFITAYVDNNDIISDGTVFEQYNYRMCYQGNKSLYFSYDYDESRLGNLKYFNCNNKITLAGQIIFDSLDDNKNYCFDEDYYYKKAYLMAKELNKINQNNVLRIIVNDRSKFQKSEIFNEKFENVDLVISNDLSDYSINEYRREEEKLDLLLKDIKDNDYLSKFEKYIAVYNIVKNYKPYKNYDDAKSMEDILISRSLKYILDNEYIVCVGFANLFSVLLNKVGIESELYDTEVLDEDEQVDNSETKMSGHARLLVNLCDDKYNIDGYFISDPTWDNKKNKNDKDEYNFLINDIDSMRDSVYMFSHKTVDYFLDIHNFSEYNEKLNKLISRYMIEDKEKVDSSKLISSSYRNVYKEMMYIFYMLDNCEFKKLLYKYPITNKDANEEFYENFFSDAGNYLITKCNKGIDDETIFKAIDSVNNKIYKKDTDKKVRKFYDERNRKVFPYKDDIDWMMLDNNNSIEENDNKHL